LQCGSTARVKLNSRAAAGKLSTEEFDADTQRVTELSRQEKLALKRENDRLRREQQLQAEIANTQKRKLIQQLTKERCKLKKEKADKKQKKNEKDEKNTPANTKGGRSGSSGGGVPLFDYVALMNTAVAAAAKTTLTASEDRANRADQSDKQTTDLLRLGREAAYFQGRDAVNDVMSSRLYDIIKATISGAVGLSGTLSPAADYAQPTAAAILKTGLPISTLASVYELNGTEINDLFLENKLTATEKGLVKAAICQYVRANTPAVAPQQGWPQRPTPGFVP